MREQFSYDFEYKDEESFAVPRQFFLYICVCLVRI